MSYCIWPLQLARMTVRLTLITVEAYTRKSMPVILLAIAGHRIKTMKWDHDSNNLWQTTVDDTQLNSSSDSHLSKTSGWCIWHFKEQQVVISMLQSGSRFPIIDTKSEHSFKTRSSLAWPIWYCHPLHLRWLSQPSTEANWMWYSKKYVKGTGFLARN